MYKRQVGCVWGRSIIKFSKLNTQWVSGSAFGEQDFWSIAVVLGLNWLHAFMIDDVTADQFDNIARVYLTLSKTNPPRVDNSIVWNLQGGSTSRVRLRTHSNNLYFLSQTAGISNADMLRLIAPPYITCLLYTSPSPRD